MWKASAGHNVKSNVTQDDDWDTDPDFVNDVSEKEQRWGSKSVEGSGKPKEAVDLNSLRNKVTTQHEQATQKEYQSKPGFSYGYGGKFGVQTDRMDKSAVGYDDMSAPQSTHSSVPKYEKPALAVKPTDIKKRLEEKAASNESARAVEEARKKRAELEKAERERVAAENEAKRAVELEAAKNEEEKRRIEEAQARARAEEEEERRRAEEEEAKLAAQAQAQLEAQAQESSQGNEPAQEQADSQYSEYVDQQATGFEGGFSAQAVYEYVADGEDELSFSEGDIISNIEVIDEGWWRGECNGLYGLFPANYVQPMQ